MQYLHLTCSRERLYELVDALKEHFAGREDVSLIDYGISNKLIQGHIVLGWDSEIDEPFLDQVHDCSLGLVLIAFFLLALMLQIQTSEARLNRVFKTGALVLIGFDFWTDLNYGTMASGLGGQIAFAAITSFIVAFFGVIGINLVFSAILEMA